MRQIKVTSSTQKIDVRESSSSSELIITRAGPMGPPGIQGPPGPQGPIGLSGIHVGTVPPEDTTILWYDTN